MLHKRYLSKHPKNWSTTCKREDTMKNNNQSKRVSSLPFTSSTSGGAAISRFKLFLLGILGVSLAAPLAGSVHRLAPSVDARVYYIMNKKERFPVIGAGADSKVKALLPDKQTKLMKYDYISWIEKSLPPVGRITVCDSDGQSTGMF